MFVYCIQTSKDIVKLLSRPSSPIMLVFLTTSQGNRFSGVLDTRGVVYLMPLLIEGVPLEIGYGRTDARCQKLE